MKCISATLTVASAIKLASKATAEDEVIGGVVSFDGMDFDWSLDVVPDYGREIDHQHNHQPGPIGQCWGNQPDDIQYCESGQLDFETCMNEYSRCHWNPERVYGL